MFVSTFCSTFSFTVTDLVGLPEILTGFAFESAVPEHFAEKEAEPVAFDLNLNVILDIALEPPVESKYDTFTLEPMLFAFPTLTLE